ncbi:hypothetical protein KL918_004601 [Ogataea parapolymorpha]|uniref:MFS transporter n=1 Tax=Ogataea parapolymorpha (strain ATCC 26012 / BCRC 20466 / JCM 22074 / NRRL Y-7560 / DL-1) TaxID=871575 RepID=W1QL94_OGAPD|nr:MFS transporter [Ogataea parapolymorpha DL-1]ESX03556.1 MFS transporter [Ogataea parapolymorpha DL-1]KAG7865359.1 hypothetical protein KL918_004601 [Ogataea parapolymorpha]KAG7873804.1 hypothetical protein KL916_001964 [Ogataea parapolymorpha]
MNGNELTELKSKEDSQGSKQGTVHRRTSTSMPHNSIAPLTDSANILPVVPESLPTTPGYELNTNSYFDGAGTNSYFDLASTKGLVSARPPIPPAQQPLSTSFESGRLGGASHKVEGGMTLDNPPRNKWRVISVVLWAVSAGLSDAAPGALLPTIEKYYNISYAVVSLIWLANAIGFIIIALICPKMEPLLGKRKMTSGGCLALVVMYALVSPGYKFPLVVVGFFFGGLGLATCLSQQNIFLSKFERSSQYLGYFHGGYGLGACVGPLIATGMIDSGVKWHLYYLILLGMSMFNFWNMWFAFKGADDDLKPWDNWEPKAHTPTSENPGEDDGKYTMLEETLGFTETLRQQEGPQEPKEESMLKVSLKNPRTWLLAFFVLFYQGAEVSMGGWVVTFLEVYRGGEASSTGYVSSGFWGGLTIGRLFLTTNIHKFLGAKRGVTIMIIGAIITTVLGWVIPILIVEAVAVSFAGIFIGPIYPLMITIAVRILPRKIQVISLTIMTAFGSSGGALFPFLVGLVSQYAGAFVCMPFVIGLLTCTCIIWFLLPNPDRPRVTNFVQRVW